MIMRVDYSIFEDAFRSYNRLNHFPKGLRELYTFFEELEDSTGEPIELDVVAICCDFAEDTIESVLSEYGLDSLEELEDNTLVIRVDDTTIIYQSF